MVQETVGFCDPVRSFAFPATFVLEQGFTALALWTVPFLCQCPLTGSALHYTTSLIPSDSWDAELILRKTMLKSNSRLKSQELVLWCTESCCCL